MPRYVALFRGINVGKAKRIAMADLKRLLASLGYSGVETLLNSGNAIFTAPAQAEAKIAARVREAVASRLEVDAFVVVKSAKDIAAIVASDPVGAIATDPSRFFVALTHDDAGLDAIRPMERMKWDGDVVRVGKLAAYAWCPEGALKSKAALALLKNLGELGTTRNWATLRKINDLLEHTA